MAPAFGAQDPTSNRDRGARSKQIPHSSHDGQPAAHTGTTLAPDDQGGRQQEEEPREEHGQLAQPPKLPHPSPVSVRPRNPNNTAPPPRHEPSPSGPSVHDAVRPQLSERDSIFATHYISNSPVTIPEPRASRGTEGRSADDEGRHEQPQLQPPPHVMAAASPLRRTSLDFSPALHKDRPPSALPLYQTYPFHQTTPPSRASNASAVQQYHRRSLYDLHGLGTSLTIANILQQTPKQNPQLPDSPLTRDDSPNTPNSLVSVVDYAHLAQSAEREQYRSWRKGQAKMNGMTIAQSQRLPSTQDDSSVDKVIDAQLPQPDPPMANARSRKASHYLGLFRENEAEEKRETEKKKAGRSRDASGETKSQISKDREAQEEKERTIHEPSIVEDLEPDDNDTEHDVSQHDTVHQLPLGLLEEIRNHHHIAPATSRKIDYSNHAPGQDHERRVQKHAGKSLRSEDEDSDQEHISSATYWPHQGVAPADSPNDDQVAERKTHETAGNEKPSGDPSSDVQVSLQSESARDYLHGISRTASVLEFEPLPQPAIISDSRASDSEYESDTYGYESTASGEDEEEAEQTPTATPLIKAQQKNQSPVRRRSGHVPEPVGAVELKPFKHQVGGHTPVYRFSRRAVCKQLNSKENMFYETVEQHHPDLLGFMPRYIGVLNVTYRKEQRKRKHTVSDEAKPQEIGDTRNGSGQTENSSDPDKDVNKAPDNIRMISHSMRAPQDVPQVILENNRHLIPDSLFPSRPMTPELQRVRPSLPMRENQSDDETSNGTSHRPSLKPTASWGFTSVNEKLRDRVLREVFAPPHIHKHDRKERAIHARSLRKLPAYTQEEPTGQKRQNSVDIASLHKYRSAEQNAPSSSHLESRRRQHLTDISEAVSSDVEGRMRDSKAVLSKSAEASEIEACLTVPPSRPHHKRRHSGGGLTRKPTDIDGSRGDLEFHENEDEAYAADGENVFSMDDVDKRTSAKQAQGSDDDDKALLDSKMALRLGPAIEFGIPEPRNPEMSLVQMDERVVRFLLLEDLTAGMQKPCVLDLKMGTRQYGVEANEKKQASQRMKCKTTTSRELGVRVCGMQVYNVRDQKYNFEDKYYGRDLKAGGDFQNALRRFFFDGIGHAQALKHIPSVLEKINQLDVIIRRLPGYRLYASSLLMIYDRGDADVAGKVKPEKNEDGKPAQYPDIKLKIVDFANCVTAEDMDRVLSRPCPPANPDAVDRGYLRGLRTLRAYFQKIYQDLQSERYVERGEGEGMAIDQRGISNATTHKGWTDSIIDDPGHVSV